jgi:ribosomal protein L19E
VRAATLPAKFGQITLSVLPITVALCLVSNLANAGALYKWIDENGQIRYSDRLPAAQVKKKHHQLNSQGVVLSTKEAAKSEARGRCKAQTGRRRGHPGQT